MSAGFNFDAPECNCCYKQGLFTRNMTGHGPHCPVYRAWYNRVFVRWMMSKDLNPVLGPVFASSAPEGGRNTGPDEYSARD